MNPMYDESSPSNVDSDLVTQLSNFWLKQHQDAKTPCNFKNQILPLARIKKIMKLDDDVKMISAEAPILFSKALEMFICELTIRAWSCTEDNKRRTLQKNDIAAAISKCEMFDFLIDIVPRDEIKNKKINDEDFYKSPNGSNTSGLSTPMVGERIPSNQHYESQTPEQSGDPNQPFLAQQQYQLMLQQKQQMDHSTHPISQTIHSQQFQNQPLHPFPSQYNSEYM